MSSLEHRPHLNEGAVGNEFQLPAFLALIACIGLIGGWVYSARGMLGSFLGFASGRDKVVTVQSVEYDTASVYGYGAGYGAGAAPAGDEDAAPAPTVVPDPVQAECVVQTDLCTVENVRALRDQSHCAVECGP